MAFKLIAYRESVAASQTDDDQAAILGQGDFVTNGHHVLDRDLWLVAAFNSGLGNTQARIDVPELRAVAPVHIRIINRTLLPGAITPLQMFDRRRNPIRIRANQEIRILQSTDATAGPNNTHTGLFIHDGNFAVGTGPAYVIRATGTTTLVAGAWTQVALTYQDQLPPGVYEITGFDVICTTGVFARLIFSGETFWRAGTICQANEGAITLSSSWNTGGDVSPMGLGSYGKFSNIYLPTVEILANAADTAETVYLYCRKVA